jgi:hypothetical protein
MDPHASLFAAGPQVGGTLPPGERDFQVFERVVVEGATTRQAAAQFGLSQTRIVQIRQRVAEWIGKEVPPTESLTARQRLVLAGRIAEQRIDFLYSEVMEAWRASQGSHTIIRNGDNGETQITRDSHGDVRYLAMAARISGLTISLSAAVERAMPRGEREQDQEAQTGGNANDADQHHREVDTSRSPGPPVGDCSEKVARPPRVANEVAKSNGTNLCLPEICDEIESRRRTFLAALADDTSPVQPPRIDAGGLLIEQTEAGEARPLAAILQVNLDPSSPLGTAATIERPLTRQRRRARQKLLERKLREKAK